MEVLLQQYSDAEKTAYLSTIAALASADRSASAAEEQFLTALAESAQLPQGAAQQVLAAANDATNQSIAGHLDVLKNSELRYSLVADIISFAQADGKYSPEEEQMLQKMAAYLGVSADQVQVLGQAVAHTQQAPPVQNMEQAKSLFGGGNNGSSSGGGIGDKLRSVGIEPGTLAKTMLGILAPILISKVMSGRSGSGGGLGGMMGGQAGGGMGGGLLGALGGLLGAGVLGGGQPARTSGGGLGGGLGSLMGVLGGLGGGQRGYGGLGSGGLGSVLGGLLGGR